MDELMNQDENNAPAESADTELLFIESDERKKNRSDDVMLTQGIFCAVLALAVFSIGFINEDFQKELLSFYHERIHGETEPFLQKLISAAEEWFRR